MNPKLGIILVTTNEEHNLKLLFSSIKRQSCEDIALYLIDNNSSDNSVSLAQKLYPSIKVKKLNKNIGFASANNLGAKVAIEDGCDLLFILNNDTELHPDCIKELVSLSQKDEQIGCTGPIVFKYSQNKNRNIIQEYGGHIDFKNYKIKKNYVNQIYEKLENIPESMDVEFIMGGAFIIRADLVRRIGLFEPRYFIYGDEIDLSYRVIKKGYKLCVTKKAKLWHNHYPASDNLKRYYFERYYILRNKYLYFLKYKLYKGLIVSFIRDVAFSLFLYKGYIKRCKFKVIFYHFRGIFDGIRNIKGKSDRIWN